MTRHRIVSLIPSATEIVCALGFESALVGRSHECDFPATVARVPVCTAPKFDPDGSSYEIDQRVKAIVGDALSVYRVDADLLRALRPTLIVTQQQCEVCAVSVRDVDAAVGDWLDDRPQIVALAPTALADIFTDIGRVAAALGVPERGADLVSAMHARMRAVHARAARAPHRPRVACIEWLSPLMAAGNWMPDLLTMAHAVNIFGAAGQHSPWLAWGELVQADPDCIVVVPCGFAIARTRQEIGPLTAQPSWPSLRAVRSDAVFLADGNQYFNRPGPRIVESLEILAELLHPSLAPARHAGHGWQRLSSQPPLPGSGPP